MWSKLDVEGGRGELGGSDEDGCELSQPGGSAGYANDLGFFGLRGGSIVWGVDLLSGFDMRSGEGEGGWKN
jgi:hypothetical protein